MKETFLLLCTVFGTVYAQMIFKFQAGNLKIDKFDSVEDGLLLLGAMFRPLMLSAFAAMFAGTMCWLLAVKTVPLTRAYMFIGLTFVLVMLIGSWLFKEPLTFNRILGCSLIIVGVLVGARP